MALFAVQLQCVSPAWMVVGLLQAEGCESTSWREQGGKLLVDRLLCFDHLFWNI